MGLTAKSTGRDAVDGPLKLDRQQATDRVVALAGNPNVGKSTVFNALTGMNQHTGNWPGKTVASAQGRYTYRGRDYILVDLPGTYSLMAHSAEEEVARDFLLYGGADAAVVVCDATCLERNMNLVLQTLEITPRVAVVINLMDEAKKKGIEVDLDLLETELGVPVVGASARSGKGLKALSRALERLADGEETTPRAVRYLPGIEAAVDALEPTLNVVLGDRLSSRWAALRLLADYEGTTQSVAAHTGIDLTADPSVEVALGEARHIVEESGLSLDTLEDKLVACTILAADEVCMEAVALPCRAVADRRDRAIDKWLTSKRTGIPIMLLLLSGIFWFTIAGANVPSDMLADLLFGIGDKLSAWALSIGMPGWLHGLLIEGVFDTLAWVVSVMLPPMAIFFPLFTLLEDFGYLPRVAFNLDHYFKKAKACGKQALTMAMGFGCNAAGVVGCRIIDSPRERLIAIITNNFVPCNGRFPTLIAIISMFFLGSVGGLTASILSALLLTGVILLGVGLTFLVSRFLSETILRGEPSSFTLELPPYRTPQVGKVIVRSIFDRTLFVLGRAVAVAAPAGMLIWTMANVTVGDVTLLAHAAGFLDPFANLLGLDGIILLAFILGFPANEIVMPIIIMGYLASGTMVDITDLTLLRSLLIDNGWTWVTAVSTMLFCLIHWPCSTTCLTIQKESGSLKWTALSILLPTLIGMSVCFIFTGAVRLLGLG